MTALALEPLSPEPLSPELVLVSPELRERALAALPEQPWLAFVPRTPEAVAPPPRLVRDVARYLVGLLVPLLLLGLASLLVTLVMTVIAGTARP